MEVCGAFPSAPAMRIAYDSQADVLSVVFVDAEADASRELSPGLIVNLDRAGQVVGVDLTNASRRIGRTGLHRIAIDLHPVET